MKKIVFMVSFLLMGSVAGSKGALADVLILTNGDRLPGKIVQSSDESFVLKSEVLGTLTVSRLFVDQRMPESLAKDRAWELPKEEKPKEEKPKIWDGKIYAGFNRTRGNVKSTDLTGGFLFHRKVEKKKEFHLNEDSFYSANDRKMNAQKHTGMARFAYSFGEQKKWYNFYKTEAERDRFANIDWRVTPSTGVGYWFFDREKLKLMIEAGGGITHTDFREDKDSHTELVLVPRGFGEVKLFDWLTLSEDIMVYPSLSDLGEYRMKFETVGVGDLTDHWGIRVSWVNEYNSNPGPGTKEHDMYLTSGLEFSF